MVPGRTHSISGKEKYRWRLGWDVIQLTRLEDGGVEVDWLLAEPYHEGQPTLSPDGKWICFQTDESGEGEIYVQAFPPGKSTKRRITYGGIGRRRIAPRWSRNGAELVFEADNQLWSIEIATEPALIWQDPVALFDISEMRLRSGEYDVSPDGQRFVFVQEPERTESPRAPEIRVVLNWFEELKEKVPIP